MLLARDKTRAEKILSEVSHGMGSFFFIVEEEEVIIEIMQTCKIESWKIRSVIRSTRENLLHYFVRKRYEKALGKILQTESALGDVLQLCFEENLAEKIPLRAILSQGIEESALKLWKFMEKNSTSERLAEILSKQDSRRSVNIFHKGSYHSQNELLTAICSSKILSKDCVEKGITRQNVYGRTALDLCTKEDTVLGILRNFDHVTNQISWTDEDGKNILHHYARKNFSRAIQLLLKKLDPLEVRKMIFKKSTTSENNVLMIAAVYGSSESLELLLAFLSFFRLFSEVDDEMFYMNNMNEILHEKNKHENTLLLLCLQQEETLQAPLSLLLGMEKKFHSEKTPKGEDIFNEEELTQCFHDHLNSSEDVLKALQEVKGGNKKGKRAIVWIWIQSFVTKFLLPMGTMASDVLFDVFLVREYSTYDQDCLNLQWMSCHSFQNQTSGTICGQNAARIPQGDGRDFFCVPDRDCGSMNMSLPVGPSDSLNIFCAPLKLCAQSRFYYSLGFVLWPWLCYTAEFLHSGIFETMNQV